MSMKTAHTSRYMLNGEGGLFIRTLLASIDYRSLIIALVSIFLGATGQFLFRLGMISYGKVTVVNIWKQLVGIITTPAIFIGFVCFGISSILWLVVISRWELSSAYPLVSLGYVIAIIYGATFLQEVITLPKIVGSGLILLGISILGLLGQAKG
jgi:drug/metabolite transporter (DMT)-like permease